MSKLTISKPFKFGFSLLSGLKIAQLTSFLLRIAFIIFILSMIPVPDEFKQAASLVQQFVNKNQYLVNMFALDVAIPLMSSVYVTRFTLSHLFRVIK